MPIIHMQDIELGSPVGNTNDSAGASLPNVEEIRTNGKVLSTDEQEVSSRQQGRLVPLLYCCIACVSIILVVSIIKIVGPDPKRMGDTEAAAINFLESEGVSSPEALYDTNSPQFKAVQWMTVEDEANFPIPNKEASDLEKYHYITRYVLTLSYFAMGGAEWYQKFNFLTADDVCSWNGKAELGYGQVDHLAPGVYCNEKTGFIDTINLYQNNLKGILPSEIGKLTTLTLLDLDENEISGNISPKLCELNQLRDLHLGKNVFTGPVPSCHWPYLERLKISNNELTGELPISMASMTKLQHLFISNNALSGNPLPIFNNLESLTILVGNNNNFDGAIGESFLPLEENKIMWVDLSNNSFTGMLPSHLFTKTSLQVFDMSRNKLSGSIPNQFSSGNQLQVLSLYENELSGSIPADIDSLSNLHHLDLSANLIDGDIPSSIGNLAALKILYLSNNPFTAGSIPDSFANLSELEELSLRNTRRIGELPEWIGNFEDLYLLDLSENMSGLVGNIPESYNKLEKLEFLVLYGNPGISGVVPDTWDVLRVAMTDETSIQNTDTLCTSTTALVFSSDENCSCCLEMPIDVSLANIDANWDTNFRRTVIHFSDKSTFLH